MPNDLPLVCPCYHYTIADCRTPMPPGVCIRLKQPHFAATPCGSSNAGREPLARREKFQTYQTVSAVAVPTSYSSWTNRANVRYSPRSAQSR